MSCRDARRLFTARLDGRLDRPGDRERLEAHLAACGACRAELARWEAAARALRAAGPTPIADGLAERAFRAATGGRRALAPGAWFLPAARRAALAGALGAAAVWIGVLASGGAERPAETAQDPLEVAVLLWMTEVPSDGD
jgi:anti-sigma factor RsiW